MIRNFRTVTIKPTRPITPSNEVTHNNPNNNQMAPVKNPRKIPKMPQEQWLEPIYFSPPVLVCSPTLYAVSL
ncbi:hypothetical protein V7139_24000 [Neobacillus drentensis]|uniref:hypothetical protein n=1 Tax=Neobacillus drentensis TaxID=220684 RepID=UPI0030018103